MTNKKFEDEKEKDKKKIRKGQRQIHWERFSDLMKLLNIPDKLRNSNLDIED